MTGVVDGSPCSMALASSSTSWGVKPERAATTGSILNVKAVPLVVPSMPSSTSTTPGIFLMALASTGAQCRKSSPSLKSLMTTGWGALVRSPIMSCRSCGNSTSSNGSACVIFARTSAITSSPECVRWLAEALPNNFEKNDAIGLNLTLISP